MCELACQIVQKNLEEKKLDEEQAIDSLFDEFAGELTLLKSFPPGIDETNCHPETEIRLTKRLLYDNSSPHPPEEIVSNNSNADIESFSPSPFPNKDSDSHMEEIDLSFNPDDPMPSGIEDNDYDSGRDILILEELLDNYSLVQYSRKHEDSRQRILLLEEFADELALISYPPDYDDYHTCDIESDIESDIREIEFFLFQGEDSDFKDSINQSVPTHCDDLFLDPTPEMFAKEQPFDYSFPPRFDVYPDDFLE
nr:hypothetical protein [Tanacetum cinerariifolium]